ncbi:MAG: DUF1272 domain-containing protein [Acidobacteriota bacterium]
MRKDVCELCPTPLTEEGLAFVCWLGCTFCGTCAEPDRRCPNCGGELVLRPRRPGLEVEVRRRVEAFNDCWRRGDVAGLLSHISDDCVYCASVGPEPGQTYVGRREVERGFRLMLAYEDLEDASAGEVLVLGNRAVCEWSYHRTDGDGRRLEIRGCDLFVFEGTKIRRKDAFTKALPCEGSVLPGGEHPPSV